MKIPLRRLAWAFVDQASVSLTSFLVVAAAARNLNVSAFGAFALALSFYYLALTLTRAVTNEVALIVVPGGPGSSSDLAQQAAITLAVAWAALGLAVSIATDGYLRSSLASVAVVIPLLIAQDIRRSLLIAERRMPRAAVASGVVLLVLAFGLAGARSHLASIPLLMALWGASCGVSLLVMRRGWRRPSQRAVRLWLGQTSTYWPRFASEAAVYAGAGQLAIMLSSAVGGLSVAAGIRGAGLLMTPLTVSLQAAGQFLVAEAGHLRQARYRLFSGLVASGFFILVSGTCMLVLLLPSDWLTKIVGDSLSVAQVALPGMAVYITLGATTVGAVACFRVSGRVREAWRIRMITTPLVISAPILAWLLDDPVRGASLGFAAAGLTNGAAWAVASWTVLGRKGRTDD